jgi:hypothetical protein
LKFAEALEKAKKEIGGEMDRVAANIPIADKDAASAAIDLTERAKQSVESCRGNYDGGRYAKAAEDLQQAVELPSKAYGLLTGTMKPTDPEMKCVGHDSYKAFLVHFEDFYPKQRALLKAESDIFGSKYLDNFLLRGIARNLKAYADDQLNSLPTEDKVRTDIAELLKVDHAEMWKASLDLDMTNKWVSSSLADLEKKMVLGGKTQGAVGIGQGAVSTLNLFSKDTINKVKMASYLGAMGQKIFPLSVLTCWHHSQSVYPSMGRYWDLGAYNASKPFIKAIPKFITVAQPIIDNGIAASNWGLELGGAR